MPEFVRGFTKVGQYLYMKGDWSDSVKDTLFKVEFTQMIPYLYPVEINKGAYVDIDFSSIGLYPKSYETVYEIGISVKGDALIYPMIPANQYYNKLEASGFVPSDDLSINKYIGGFDEDILKSGELKEYTVRDYQSIVYRVFGDSYRNTKAVLKFMVNRMHVVRASTEETEEILSNVSKYVANGMLRVACSYELARW